MMKRITHNTILFFQNWIILSTGLSLGQSIQSVSSLQEGIQVAGELWLPSDQELPPHYSQPIHHESRQRWASQLLDKMFQISTEETLEALDFRNEQWNRLVNAAAIPHETAIDRPKKEGVWLCTSLQSIHGIVSRKQGISQDDNIPSHELQSDTLLAIRRLIERAYQLAEKFSLDQACQLHWSVEGLYARIPEIERLPQSDSLLDRLDKLPFEIVPRGLDWSNVCDPGQVCEVLVESIPFSKETIITRKGVSVQERRGTAWIADPQIGSLAYSGKLMVPKPIPDLVLRVMRSVEDRLDLGGDGNFFDCALCNHYADATAACKFHTDPEHGTFWHRTTVVVAAGTDRKFAFKPIETFWSDWDPCMVDDSQQSMAASINLFSGDLVVMKDNCNDDFYHAVHVGGSDDDRVSLVLKRALDRNGKKGHGQQGQGRKSRRKIHSVRSL
ncbi:unnamed protein product [Cylindrotheca closterium]|uniref:Fe2OG dioxygenase domain-containing protein n=1 Tax=Cylindrotheca closterium TaxID=2856 RepID=A0AAD2CHY0_9STRA|nr:unnamed protein product [Cylindrotheca closterium]